ncbi:MAG: TRAP transporter small permease subunit [Haliscomenobacter sp.]|nr:TRAP transporter small permease subunit [Haliscomenobacter sp.]MBK8653639.1 TRAP transporter small permease subunit [Haliscomenobacter sp.]MBP9077912.1 TRAP transporter small permease subunit [Haliscomenobacter sp.]MBP9873653.1 TRAP transporter small permease subunit [Haliscomenobacter sp.]
MRPFFISVATGIDRINERVGEWASWLNVVLVLLVCVDVFNRYALNYTAAWVAELEWHLFALVFLLGAGFAWKHDRHVRVDLFYVRFQPKDKALTDIVGTLFFLLPWSFTLMVVSWRYAWKSFLIRETSPDPGGIPALYWIKFAISAGMLLLFLQGIARLIHNLQAWRTGREPLSN